MQLLSMLGCEVKTSGTGLFVWAKIPSSFENGESLSDWALQHMRILSHPAVFWSGRHAVCTVIIVQSCCRF